MGQQKKRNEDKSRQFRTKWRTARSTQGGISSEITSENEDPWSGVLGPALPAPENDERDLCRRPRQPARRRSDAALAFSTRGRPFGLTLRQAAFACQFQRPAFKLLIRNQNPKNASARSFKSSCTKQEVVGRAEAHQPSLGKGLAHGGKEIVGMNSQGFLHASFPHSGPLRRAKAERFVFPLSGHSAASALDP